MKGSVAQSPSPLLFLFSFFLFLLLGSATARRRSLICSRACRCPMERLNDILISLTEFVASWMGAHGIACAAYGVFVFMVPPSGLTRWAPPRCVAKTVDDAGGRHRMQRKVLVEQMIQCARAWLGMAPWSTAAHALQRRHLIWRARQGAAGSANSCPADVVAVTSYEVGTWSRVA